MLVTAVTFPFLSLLLILALHRVEIWLDRQAHRDLEPPE